VMHATRSSDRAHDTTEPATIGGSADRASTSPAKTIRNSRRFRLVLWSLPVIAFIVAAIVGPMLVDYNPVRVNITARLEPPGTVLSDGSRAWLGTDQVGQDVFAQVLQGARVSLLVGAATILLAGLIGLVAGVIAGFQGGWIDTVLMRLADIQLAFPFILLAIMVLVVLGAGFLNLVIVLAIGQWVTYARIARGETISQKRKDYIESARAIGVHGSRIVRRGILPNILAPLIVIASFNVAGVILSEAALSFLGLGVPPEVPTWGGMLAESRDQLLGGYWWLAVFPGVAIMITVLSLNILGDWMRDFLDPRLRGR